MNIVPISTWEQLGIVLVFAVILLAFLGLGYKYVQTVIEKFQLFINEQNASWQSFLDRVRSEDRASLESREKAFSERNAKVVESLDALAKTIQEMRLFDTQHHTSMTDAIIDMRATVRDQQRTKNRSE